MSPDKLQSIEINFDPDMDLYFLGMKTNYGVGTFRSVAKTVITYANRIFCNEDMLPFQDMLEAVGHYLCSLSISTEYLVLGKSRDSEFILDTASGYFLDHIFKHCPKLTKLVVMDGKLLHCDPTMEVNNPIRDLTLENVTLGKDILPELSTRLPSLENLTIGGGCDYESKTDIAVRRRIDMDMKNTSFKNFSITVNVGWSNTIMMKIKQLEGDYKYFKCNHGLDDQKSIVVLSWEDFEKGNIPAWPPTKEIIEFFESNMRI